MARAKRTEKFNEVYKSMSLEDKKILMSELKYAISDEEKSGQKEELMKAAVAKRDALKIGAKASVEMKDQTISGTVVGISVDKVKLETENGTKSYSILKLK